jgi:hypothetical protein
MVPEAAEIVAQMAKEESEEEARNDAEIIMVPEAAKINLQMAKDEAASKSWYSHLTLQNFQNAFAGYKVAKDLALTGAMAGYIACHSSLAALGIYSVAAAAAYDYYKGDKSFSTARTAFGMAFYGAALSLCFFPTSISTPLIMLGGFSGANSSKVQDRIQALLRGGLGVKIPDFGEKLMPIALLLGGVAMKLGYQPFAREPQEGLLARLENTFLENASNTVGNLLIGQSYQHFNMISDNLINTVKRVSSYLNSSYQYAKGVIYPEHDWEKIELNNSEVVNVREQSDIARGNDLRVASTLANQNEQQTCITNQLNKAEGYWINLVTSKKSAQTVSSVRIL